LTVEEPQRSASPLPGANFANCPLIYSEPALAGDMTPMFRSSAISESFLPNLPFRRGNAAGGDSGIASIGGEGQTDDDPSKESDVLFINNTPKHSMCLSEISCATVATRQGGHKTSFSTREIREQHQKMQERYRPKRQRHFTDPVDFEGVLNIIGGCSWWQIWVYVLISMQQIPHAMFNLNVVYMMYNPEHWCQVPGFHNSTDVDYLWTLEDAMNTTIIFPRTTKSQRDSNLYHDQCHYFDRGQNRFEQLRKMTLEDAIKAVDGEPAIMTKCTNWEYKKDVMEETIVTDWNLVCDDNLMRGHAHLFYSFGYLVGCLLGGFASDSFGRKPTVIGFGILSSLFGVFLPYTTYFPMFLFIRFCSAVCNEAADLAAYILCMEITGVKYRAMIGSLLQAPWAVGYALLALLAYFCKSWKTIQTIAAGLHFCAVLIICTIPESPRWLIVSNRVAEAEEVIRKACREPPFPFNLCRANKGSLPSDLELVRHRETSKWVRAQNGKVTLWHLFKIRELRFRSLILCIVFMATALVYYGIVIALSDQSAPGRVLFSGNFFFNNAIAGAIELPTLISCVYLMKFGRKRAQMVTLVCAGLCLIIALLAVQGKTYMVALLFMMMGKICVQGAFNILYIFSSELYPTIVRNSAVGFSSMIARFGAGVSSYIAMLSDVTLPIVPMMIFAIFSLVAGVLVMLLPETNGLPLPETIEDAVTLLKSSDKNRAACYGFMMGNEKSMSLLDEPIEAELSSGNQREQNEAMSALGVSVNGSFASSISAAAAATERANSSRNSRRRILTPRGSMPRAMGPPKDESQCGSLAQEMATISIPERLPEAFDDK
ncbi:unnamed protein product, partial [Mesorhabditis belari]|uniref:Major facilitator superfamily (MFS) profile domain-containing protein n=1 Tax=Mesorhabditis belari TaxID=2138241 RepID=A0AAF3JC64_9BILA